MAIPVKLEVFEGPLDLLLHLIHKNKIDIYDIPIVEITNQYLDYIEAMDEANMDVMSEFLMMAATLLEIKCRMLLPKEVNEEGEEEDPRAELVNQLLQYKMYKYMSYELKDMQVDAEKTMFKEPTLPKEVLQYEEPINLDELLADVSLEKLQSVFQEVMRRKEASIDPIRSRFKTIEKEDVSLSDKLVYVEQFAKVHEHFSFRELLMRQSSKMHVVVTFLAILELMKLGTIKVEQENVFDEIMIHSQIA